MIADEDPAALRSRTMRAVRSRDTSPEMTVRRLVHRLGYRFRLHRKDLPGVPDLVFPARRKVIFVHGCFWHGHDCRRGARTPKTNRAYWIAKIERNRARDQVACGALAAAGWEALVVWECALADRDAVRDRVVGFLGPRTAAPLQQQSNSSFSSIDAPISSPTSSNTSAR